MPLLRRLSMLSRSVARLMRATALVGARTGRLMLSVVWMRVPTAHH